MSFYNLALLTTSTTVNTPLWDLKAGSSVRPTILEVSFTTVTSSSGQYGLGRSPTLATQTSPVLVLADDPTDPNGQSGCAVAWSTAPTMPPVFARRHFTQTGVGNGMIWVFPRGGYVLAPSTSLVLWGIGATLSTLAVHVSVDE